jgi:hypothetical protein
MARDVKNFRGASFSFGSFSFGRAKENEHQNLLQLATGCFIKHFYVKGISAIAMGTRRPVADRGKNRDRLGRDELGEKSTGVPQSIPELDRANSRSRARPISLDICRRLMYFRSDLIHIDTRWTSQLVAN